MEGYNPRLKKLMLEVVDNQIRDNTPPETRKTLERLMANGDTRQKAKEKIAYVAVLHIYDILKEGKAFDPMKYVKDLEEIK
ncbi:MAG: hypothetical protein IJQ62_13375 [Clostridia bacterium]|nr:hypothetical protein [Clostridia bacterium]